MSNDLNAQLAETRQRIEARDRAHHQRVTAEDELTQREYHLNRLEHTLEVMSAEIGRLENPGLLGFLGSFLGNSVDKLEKLRSEQYEMQRECDEVRSAVGSLREQLDAIAREVEACEGIEERLSQLVAEKERTIADRNDDTARQFAELAGRATWAQEELRRTERAVEAGETVLKRIDDLAGALSRARKSQLHGATGAIVNAGWNTIKAHGARTFVNRLREGLERLTAAIEELDSSDGSPEDMEIARLDAMIKHAAADYAGGWEQGAIYDANVMCPIESEVSELVGHLKAKLEDRKQLAEDLDRKRQQFIENA
jgi:hypothetical protein